eukprot:CAMPEP_0170737290 /NCGR_PEP_ID=MMETSP0437-20130122/4050_1 /TAXON_ID=0 /ORGANISM="Sexangularia sp." /LENGTH=118 /DNA_ID=CAMNT_0011075671 /DNA_START=474 /DNA_END=830 /DNA_ORIENTATION=+
MDGKPDGSIAVVVGKVTNDVRFLDVPKMSVAALGFSKTAKARIEAAGGRTLTFDQLARERPTGKHCVLLRGPLERKALHYFGAAPGTPGSTARPYTGGRKGRKVEKARGRRASRGFKV